MARSGEAPGGRAPGRGPLTAEESAGFGRWMAHLVADAWANGWRPPLEGDAARTNENRAPHPGARFSETGEEKPGVSSTGLVAIVHHP